MTYSGPVDPADLRSLPTSEAALLLLQHLARDGGALNSNNTFRGAEQAYRNNGEPNVDVLLTKLSDAWAWLEAQAYLGPDPRQTGGWQRLTSRGREAAEDPNLRTAQIAADRLTMGLHPLLDGNVRAIFALGDHETAAFAALKAVEVRVRDLAGIEGLGVPLMRSAFKKDGGVLADPDADGGEQQATMDLFAGAIGTFKNPASHRTVDYGDPTEAAEVVLLADLLMRLLDRVEQRTQ
ncbi:TIGR02391 family protein [Aquihabitans sp. G128]|uniref:TIGR02391 family protein n=1 Tax=Aquihabitans sp. G128 TaxID=2849779 RepID=UPI0020B37549|nr:TIGR02391 family protein [Aquihabitans sp. G128]